MRALVVGVGSAGARHVNNLHALGVSDFHLFRTIGKSPPYNLTPEKRTVFHDFESALRGGVDLAVVANPTSLHFEYAREIIDREIPLYLEKPITSSVTHAEELVALARKKRVRVQVGYQTRFHPPLAQVKKWLTEEKIGRVLSATADVGEWLPGWHPWEDHRQSYAARKDLGGGVIRTLSHDIDYLCWLLGAPLDVYAMGGTRSLDGIDVEDTALLSLRFPDEVPVQIRMDYCRRPPSRKLDIVGELGQIRWDYYAGEALLIDNGGREAEACRTPPGWERNHLFLDCMRAFLDPSREPSIPLEDGLIAVRTAEAALISLAERRPMRVC